MNFYLRILLIFLATSVPFGILIGGLTIFGLIAGLSFGISMTIIISLTQYISLKRKGYIISEETSGVHHTRAFVVYLPYDMTFDLCLNSLITITKCQVKSVDWQRGIIIARKGMDWLTTGDVISFKIRRIDRNRTDIQVSSKPLIPTAIVDYGSNLDNVERISSFISAHGFDLSLTGYENPSR